MRSGATTQRYAKHQTLKSSLLLVSLLLLLLPFAGKKRPLLHNQNYTHENEQFWCTTALVRQASSWEQNCTRNFYRKESRKSARNWKPLEKQRDCGTIENLWFLKGKKNINVCTHTRFYFHNCPISDQIFSLNVFVQLKNRINNSFVYYQINWSRIYIHMYMCMYVTESNWRCHRGEINWNANIMEIAKCLCFCVCLFVCFLPVIANSNHSGIVVAVVLCCPFARLFFRIASSFIANCREYHTHIQTHVSFLSCIAAIYSIYEFRSV